MKTLLSLMIVGFSMSLAAAEEVVEEVKSLTTTTSDSWQTHQFLMIDLCLAIINISTNM